VGGDRIPGPYDDQVDKETRQRREFRERHLGGEKNEKKIYKALLQVQASYAAEFLYLDEIALGVFHGRRGGFIRKYTAAWLHADAWNKRLMKPVFQALICKYNLDEDPTGTIVSEVHEGP